MTTTTGRKTGKGSRRTAKLRAMGPNYMDREMVSIEYGCSKSWLYEQAMARNIAFEMRGTRRMIFRREDVKAFFDKLYHPAIEERPAVVPINPVTASPAEQARLFA